MKKIPIIFFIGSGVGRDLRGFEAHTIDLFNHVKNENTFKAYLIKTAGTSDGQELSIPSVNRKSMFARIAGYVLKKNPYVIYQMSFFIGLTWLLYRIKPTTLYLGEPVLFNYLHRWRKFFRIEFNMVFYTGGNTIPLKIRKGDFLQLVTPTIIPLAEKRGVHLNQMMILPHFINIPAGHAIDKHALKKKLKIPKDCSVILSVGAIDSSVKRMDYLIHEVCKLSSPYFLIILGETEFQTPQIRKLAEQKISIDNFYIDRVERSELTAFYQIADIFVLASLNEGFGLVTVEALLQGLPVLVHHHDVAKYVLGNYAFYEDLSQEGNLTRLIEARIIQRDNNEEKQERRNYVINRFGWNNLSHHYLQMLHKAIRFNGS